ncbi:tetratricopeptide repeat protein [Foetidibacter luteolus]|uniref:tetratricopeptide repeat protein n=1 Tax=Foetidibacter luteolus TaxID=2608880 RepID=UPI00129C02C9|nr:tetratricopeptide repeat protein [Foetidibacter luteolus]
MNNRSNAALVCVLCILFLGACNGSDKKPAEDIPAPAPVPAYISALQEAVNKYPDSASLRLQYASGLDSIGSFKEALLHMDTLVGKDSTNYGLWFFRGQVSEEAQDTVAAIDNYTRAIKVYPSPEAQLTLANLYAEMKEKKALLICKTVRDLSLGRETDASCDFIAGIYHARTGNGELAVKLFDQCIANNFTYMPAYIEKGLVYFDNKKYDEAMKVFQFASTVNNLYADAYYYIARCYEMTGKKDSAATRFQQALSLDKNLVEAKKGLERVK